MFSALSLIFKNKRLLSFVSTLLILALLALYWPLSAANISFKSQTNRLTTLLSKENISQPLTEWALENIDKEQTRLILWTIDELTENYNSDKVVDKIISYDYSGKYRYSARSEIRNYLKVNENYDYYDKDYETYFNYRQSREDEKWIDVTWFSKLYNFSLYDEKIQGHTIKIDTDEEKYTIDLSEFVDELVKKSDSDSTENPALTIDTENYRLVISWFYWRKPYDQAPIFSNIEWYILVN